jgi:UDP:flavonoid glycosyltransferase YjiC (YdhE family)
MGTNQHIIYCWELGAGYGHVTRMRHFVNHPALSEIQFSFALREVNKANVLGQFDGSRLFQAPIINVPFPRPSPNYSHVLRRCGFNEPDMAYHLISAWRNLFSLTKPDLLLLDHAPSAAIAAISLKVPFRMVGNGFEMPNVSSPMASILPYMEIDDKTLKFEDDHIYQVFSDLERRFYIDDGALNYDSLFSSKNCLITYHPVVDHYGKRDENWRYYKMLGRLTADPIDLSGLGRTAKPIAFFYLDGRTKNLPSLLGLLHREFELFGYLSNVVDPAIPENLRKLGVKVFDTPLDIEQAFDHAEVIISNGGIGLISQALHGIKPMILIPLHIEQSMLAYRIYQQKIALVLNQNTDKNQNASLISQFMQVRDRLTQNIESLMQTTAPTHPYWEGDLVKDFLFTD